jgi:hypothetical protein
MTDFDDDAEVAEAEASAARAEELLDALEVKVASGDRTVQHEEMASATSLAQFARKQVAGARARAVAASAAKQTRGRVALRAEILKSAPTLGATLADDLAAVRAAAQTFEANAKAYTQQVVDWAAKATDLGVTSTDESDGLRRPTPGGGAPLRVDGVELDVVGSAQFLGYALVTDHSSLGGLIPQPSDDLFEQVQAKLRTVGGLK